MNFKRNRGVGAYTCNLFEGEENTPMQGLQNVNQMQELFLVELQRITGVHYERWFSFFEVLINSRVIKFEI